MIQKITLNAAKSYDKDLSSKKFSDSFLAKFWKNLRFNYYIYLTNVCLYLTKAMKQKNKQTKQQSTKLSNCNNSSIWKSNSSHKESSQVIS